MRLGIYVPYFDPRPHGVGAYVEAVCSRLAAAFPEPAIFTDGLGELPGWARRATVVMPSPLLRRLRDVSRAGKRAARMAFLQLEIRGALHRLGVDVLFSPTHDGVIGSPVPQVMVLHDLIPFRTRNLSPPLTVAYHRTIVRTVARGCRTVIAVSSTTRRDVMEEFNLRGSAIEVVPEGYEKSLFRQFAPGEIDAARARHQLTRPYFFYAGTYSPHKNLAVVARALEGLKAVEQPWDWALAGRPDTGAFTEFLSECERRGIVGRLRVLGYVPIEDLGPLHAGAAAFVFPSLYEGFGLSVLEAMASGARVLSSNAASLPEVVGDGARLLEPTDAVAWRTALRESLGVDDPGLRSRARRRAASFSWDRTAERIADLLRSAGS